MRYLISHDLRFILQSFHLLPIQYDLGVGCVPHYLYRRLTGSYQQTKIVFKKKRFMNQYYKLHSIFHD